MIAPAHPLPTATLDPQVAYVVDPTAEPGDPLPALVRLLHRHPPQAPGASRGRTGRRAEPGPAREPQPLNDEGREAAKPCPSSKSRMNNRKPNTPAKQATSTATSAPAPDSPDDYSYPIHPAANIFPMMTAEEYDGLKKDIAAFGLRQFIDLLDGQILDGRNRLRACKELHIQPDFCEVEDCDDPIAYVMSHNLHRWHLTQSQRAASRQVAKMRLGDNQHKKSEGTQSCVPTEDAAKAFSVSVRSVVTAKHVADKGDKAVGTP